MAAPMNSTPFSVEGKVAIVTGAGSGILFEFAKLLLSKNCSVVIGDLSLRPEAQALVDENRASPKAVFHKTDVADWTSLQALFDKAASEFGTFDIVCPGAGIFEPHWSNFWHPPTGAADSASKDPTSGLGHYACLDINVTHPIRATQLALAEYMKPSNGSKGVSLENPKRVVLIASTAAQAANLACPIYIASKHAVDGFARSMGPLEQSVGVRVNGVHPAIVKTPLFTEHPEKMSWLGPGFETWVTPAQVAEALVKMCEDPDMVGGTMLEVGTKQTRIVPLFGNTGPDGAISRECIDKSAREAIGWLGVDGWGKMAK